MAVFCKNGSLKINFYFQNPKKASLHGTVSFDLICVKISVGASAVGARKNQKRKQTHCWTWGVIFHPYGEKIPGQIWTIFRDVIIDANFADNLLRHFIRWIHKAIIGTTVTMMVAPMVMPTIASCIQYMQLYTHHYILYTRNCRVDYANFSQSQQGGNDIIT